MSKKRKTRKEKERTDIRHVTNPSLSSAIPTIAYTFQPVETTNRPTSTHSIPQTVTSKISHAYVIQDVKRTLVITVALILCNTLLYVMVENHFLHFHFLGL